MWVWLLSLGLAEAVEVVPVLTVGEKRVLRTEAWLARPLYDPTSTWKVHHAITWGAVIECTVIAPRVERCTFADGVAYWGFLLNGGGEPEMFRVKLPAALEITWNKRGHVTAWDFSGDMQPFYDAATTALGRLHHTGNAWFPSEDARRRVGQDLAEDLARAILAPLDLELSARGGVAEPWVVTTLPQAAYRFRTSAGTASLTVTPKEVDATSLSVSIDGEAVVSGSFDQSLIQRPETIAVRGAARYDLTGHLLQSQVVVAVKEYGAMFDYAMSHYRAVWLTDVPVAEADRLPSPCPIP